MFFMASAPRPLMKAECGGLAIRIACDGFKFGMVQFTNGADHVDRFVQSDRVARYIWRPIQ